MKTTWLHLRTLIFHLFAQRSVAQKYTVLLFAYLLSRFDRRIYFQTTTALPRRRCWLRCCWRHCRSKRCGCHCSWCQCCGCQSSRCERGVHWIASHSIASRRQAVVMKPSYIVIATQLIVTGSVGVANRVTIRHIGKCSVVAKLIVFHNRGDASC